MCSFYRHAGQGTYTLFLFLLLLLLLFFVFGLWRCASVLCVLFKKGLGHVWLINGSNRREREKVGVFCLF